MVYSRVLGVSLIIYRLKEARDSKYDCWSSSISC